MKRLKQIARNASIAISFTILGMTLAVFLMPQLTGSIVAAIGETSNPVVPSNELLVAQQQTYNQIYDTVAPSVVSVGIEGRTTSQSQWQQIGSGSGFVVDFDGHIVTNTHVVSPAVFIEQILGTGAEARVVISMFDGTITEADIIGTDSDSDIAVVQIDVPENRLAPVEFADSNALEEGQIVFAVGNPFSNNWTLTSGIISALNRSIPGLQDFQTGGVIQTDAAINPGNSGGPLVNLVGQVIGVNSQINSESGSNSGIGFAVPSNLVIRVANEIIETGDVNYSYLGIQSGNVNLNAIQAYNLPDNLRGTIVALVQPGSPASDAGLRSLTNTTIDVITAINGVSVSGFDDLIGYLSINTSPGDVVTLTVYRDGNFEQINVELGDRPN